MKISQFFSRLALIVFVLLTSTSAFCDQADLLESRYPFDPDRLGQDGPGALDRFGSQIHDSISETNTGESWNSTWIGAWAHGPCYGVAVQGSLAYVADYHGGLQIIRNDLLDSHDLEISIDVKPGSSSNSINCKGNRGVIPVAILSTKSEAAVFPNPFNPQTRISFKLDHTQHIQVAVYDIRGRCIATLAEGFRAAGEHSVVWQGKDQTGRNVPSGTYFFRVDTGGSVEIMKAVLLK